MPHDTTPILVKLGDSGQTIAAAEQDAPPDPVAPTRR